MKITRIDTISLAELPNLLFVRVHTDSGLVGHGETYYAVDAVRGFVHEVAAPLLLGTNPLSIEGHWRMLYERCARFGARGTEMRAISALDVALWDVLGHAAGLPLYQLLGGASRQSIRINNTCAGPSYSRVTAGGPAQAVRGGLYEDLEAFTTRADELALDLLGEGIGGMKIWPFDPFARARGGLRIDPADLDAGLEPFRKIRRAVGNRIDVMVEGHGYWSLPAAVQIARALEEYSPAWVEDLILADQIGALAELRRSTTIPVLASEFLMTRWEYQPLLDQHAADIVMIDPTWCGGITEARKIAAMADTYHLPVTFHDCTGPFTLFAGVHLALNAPHAVYQETVRSFIRLVYPDLVTELPYIEAGAILPPSRAGLGTALQPDIADRPGATLVSSRES
ncbi:MAG: mandelate racemase/muconate lactonizing enzyme family protein [Chloroflexota bacterium]|nr:mandelate racemase/muconate lactonizing enzyme family protein [Chloroflexota bacterium]